MLLYGVRERGQCWFRYKPVTHVTVALLEPNLMYYHLISVASTWSIIMKNASDMIYEGVEKMIEKWGIFQCVLQNQQNQC